MNGLTYDAVVANEEEIIVVNGLTYDAVVANDDDIIVVNGLTYDAVVANDALTAFKTYEDVAVV